jgi:hypothetical protein
LNEPYSFDKYSKKSIEEAWDIYSTQPKPYSKGGKIYKIQSKSKYDINPKWEDDKFYTGGKKFLSYKDAQEYKKKLQSSSSSTQFKVVEDISKSDYAKGGSMSCSCECCPQCCGGWGVDLRW